MLAKISEFLAKVAGLILSFLPDSPLKPVIEGLEKMEWLGMLNWFVPVGTFVTIGTLWLGAIAVFYTYQMILRWSKVVAD